MNMMKDVTEYESENIEGGLHPVVWGLLALGALIHGIVDGYNETHNGMVVKPTDFSRMDFGRCEG